MTANTTADDPTTSEDVEKAERRRARIHKYARMGKTRLAERSCEDYTGVPTLDIDTARNDAESDDTDASADTSESEPTKTATCQNCGYEGPRDRDADEKAVVWFEDSWMCQECKFNDPRSFGGL